MRYVISYLYLICKVNKNNNIEYILFSMFKIKIISHSNIFYLKKMDNISIIYLIPCLVEYKIR